MTDERSADQGSTGPDDVTEPTPVSSADAAPPTAVPPTVPGAADLTQPAPAPPPTDAAPASPPPAPAAAAAPLAPAAVAAPPAPAAVARPRQGGRSPLSVLRSTAVGLLFFLTCLSLVVATTAWWVDQTFVDTDAFVAVAAPLAQDPVVQETLAQATATQVSDALGIGNLGRFAAVGIARELFSSDVFAQLWEGALRTVHTTLIAILRDENQVVEMVDDQVYVNLYPFLDRILDRLATLDLTIAGRTIPLPQLTDPSDPAASRAELEAFVGRPLPATFGTVPVARGERLVAAQQAFALFEASIVVLAVVVLVLALLTVALARRRLRMIALLGVGALASLLVARLAIASAQDAVADAVTGGGNAVAIGNEIVDALASSYRELTEVALLAALGAALVATIVAWAWDRRARAAAAGSPEAAMADGWFLAIAGLCVALAALIAFGLTVEALIVVAIGYVAWLGIVVWTRRRRAAPAAVAS